MPGHLAELGVLRLAGDASIAAWDAYCRRHPNATPYHVWAWGRAVADALGHEPQYLYTEDARGITGVLPLSLRRSRVFGTNLVSVPAANVGGPIADDAETLRKLVVGAKELARELDVDYVELRDVTPESPIAGALLLDPGRYVTVAIDLSAGEPAVWSGLGRGIRRRVRRAQDAGLTIDLHGDLESFYAVYAATVKRLGSPPFSKRFFAELAAGFGKELQIGVVRQGHAVAAVDLLISFNDVVYSVFAGSRADLWDLYPNQLLLWAELQDACARGFRSFDLGRSLTASGSLEFKLSWGGRVVPLTYGYHLQRARVLPVRTPDMPLYRALGKIWSHLPDTVVEAVGPHFVKHLF
jgi:FemAB-related protein (PEP-CTERM system-associated)